MKNILKYTLIGALFSFLVYSEMIPYITGIDRYKLSDRPAICLGKVHTPWYIIDRCNSYETFKEARDLGADFVMVIKKDTDRYDKRSLSDVAFSNSGKLPDSYYSYDNYGFYTAWVYLPVNLGVQTKNFVVMGFDLGSKTANLKKYDEIIGINGIERNNENFYKQLLNLKPGDSVTLNVLRSWERLDINIITIKP